MPDNFEIAYLWVFWLLPLPLLIFWLVPPLRLRSESLGMPGFDKMASYTNEKPRRAALVRRRNFLNWVMLMLCWLLFLAALASPQLVGEPEKKVKTSRNFLVTADISFSMAREDWAIDGQKSRRWDAVKNIMHDFIEKREGDRMGLVFFGSNAYIQAPFTPDLKTVDQLLEEADVGMAGQMTRIGKAIKKGLNMFENDTIETKVMLLLTDGGDDGTDILPLDAANMAKKDSVIIYTIGIGDPDVAGSDLDEQTLIDIAELTEGRYFRAKDEQELAEIYDELDKLEPIEYEEEQNKPVTVLYHYPLAGAIGLLLLSSLVSPIFAFVLNKRREAYV
ncbi:VWA domain-containing protein [Roseivirga pacifica]|uniref:VWA domain-containing protein n=1 Tax=Roseivirga pacifica TaxID=1267423 RepID=UPI002094E071|nr:VWA domain-containing protein [Roseivirga pacifica]MCO6358686.1 VWA domain-containing protein [Roseivirga pacifica]MCO6365678.1 VWA domain-containing protein [Roseivirga pacifica]MCO6371592.1 VWA domain-containing protein [Roseivirga pacifica]MCO6376297.1 VWA domain-containing protein [Roseivirga pacifica]MCO6378970.1 VWA domain-containing protein [Roseivirga pacifica]